MISRVEYTVVITVELFCCATSGVVDTANKFVRRVNTFVVDVPNGISILVSRRSGLVVVAHVSFHKLNELVLLFRRRQSRLDRHAMHPPVVHTGPSPVAQPDFRPTLPTPPPPRSPTLYVVARNCPTEYVVEIAGGPKARGAGRFRVVSS